MASSITREELNRQQKERQIKECIEYIYLNDLMEKISPHVCLNTAVVIVERSGALDTGMVYSAKIINEAIDTILGNENIVLSNHRGQVRQAICDRLNGKV
jgi:predicted nucleic-acid-binding protein